jgi:hypothetical protein
LRAARNVPLMPASAALVPATDAPGFRECAAVFPRFDALRRKVGRGDPRSRRIRFRRDA